MIKIRSHFAFFTFIAFLLIAATTFGNLVRTFFLQDEWAIFGNFLYWQKAGLPWIERLFFYGGVTHLVPFANIFSYLQFSLFGLNFAPYALISIFLHVVNAFLVTKFVLELRGSKAIAILSGLFFLTNPTTSQAVTWIATVPGTVVSVTFTLLALIFFLRGKLIFSLLWFVLALGFKETSVFLFLYFPVLSYLTLKNDKRSSRYTLIALVIIGLLYVAARLFFRIVGPQTPAISSFSQPPVSVYVYRLITHPFKVLSQSIFPQELIINIANKMMKLGYPSLISGKVPDPYIAQSVGVDIISYVLTFFVLGIFFLMRKSALLLLSLIFIAMSVFPLIVIPGKAGYISLFDGRHLYMISIGVSIVLATLAVMAVKNFSRVRFAVACIVSIYFVYSVWYIRDNIKKQVDIATTRKTILKNITDWYPKFSTKSIVITQSDKAFYGLPLEETILPFQSGFGNTLLVWYDRHGENFPACFFEKKFLYELESQDYKECEGRGFGYFRMPLDLSTILKKYHLTKNDFISFSYTNEDTMIINTTEQFGSSLTQ